MCSYDSPLRTETLTAACDLSTYCLLRTAHRPLSRSQVSHYNPRVGVPWTVSFGGLRFFLGCVDNLRTRKTGLSRYPA